MGTHGMIPTILVLSVGLMPQLFGQERKVEVPKVKSQEKVSAEVQVKKPAPGMVHRASEIAGMTVRNSEGKDLGTVKDTVIDMKSGQVKYAALSYGGVLGLGDKMFAVPWDAFTHQHNVADSKHYLILNVDEETLKRAPGFDSEKWPNFADSQFSGGIDKYYDKFRTPADRGAKLDRPEAKPEVTTRAAESNSLSLDIVHRSSKINGMTVKNSAGKELGSVNDLVIEMETGKVRYAALSYGGFLGLGDKLFAVPWSAFELRYNPGEKEYYLVLDIKEETLRKATGFDQSNWPNFADPKISDEIDKHYRTTS